MYIPVEHYQHIRELNIAPQPTLCNYERWHTALKDTWAVPHLEQVQGELGESFTRHDVLQFYKNHGANQVSCFLAAMIWGHEVPLGEQRDTWGPFRARKSLEGKTLANSILDRTSVRHDEAIRSSYKLMSFILDKCGPNTFTKHMYFLGKSQDRPNYPLIYDNNIAMGITKLALGSNWEQVVSLLRVRPVISQTGYIAYLHFVREQAALINQANPENPCQMDQIEFYLGNHAQWAPAQHTPNSFDNTFQTSSNPTIQ